MRILLLAPLTCVSVTIPLAAQCPDGSPPPCRSVRATAPARNSVAVLYFEHASSDTTTQYLADGLTEQLIERLGQIQRLDVLSRSAVRRYRGGASDPRGAARALAVAHVVTGTVRRAGTRLRVTVELARTSDGRRLWGNLYQRADSDFFAIEEDIARSVAAAVVGRLFPQERGVLADRPTREPRAYDHYLRGNHAIAHRTPTAVAAAIAEYTAAVRLDSTFTQAVAWLAVAYGTFVDREWAYPGLSREDVLSRASALAHRALRIDSTSSDAWLAHAEILSYRCPKDLDSAIVAYRRAIHLNPRNAQALHSYGLMLEERGDQVGAIAAYRDALKADPARAVTVLNLGRISYERERYLETVALIDSTLQLDGGFVDAYQLRARVLLRMSRFDEARVALEASTRVGGDARWLTVAVAATQGDTGRARRTLDQLLREGNTNEPSPGQLDPAIALLALGDTVGALDFLERIRPRVWFLNRQLRAPEFDAIRTNPRFQRIVEEARPR